MVYIDSAEWYAILCSIPARLGLHAMILALPSAALAEAAEQLGEIKTHYQKIEAAKARPTPPSACREACAVVTEHIAR